MAFNLIGVRHVSFSDNGREIKGTRLFATFKDDNIQGLGCETIWVPSRIPMPELKGNAPFDVYYDKHGKVTSIVAL